MSLKLYIRNKRQQREDCSRGELEIDVGGLTKYEAEDFVDEVKRRVRIKKRPSRPPRGGGTGRRQTIDVNINVNRD